jgi:hypothetical protein
VRVDISHERIFKNITDHSEQFSGSIGVDEWGFAEAQSGIDDYYLEMDGDRKPSYDNPEYAGKPDAIGKKTDVVIIKSGGTVRAVGRAHEMPRWNWMA